MGYSAKTSLVGTSEKTPLKKTGAGTTFGENGKEKALYLSTGIASIGF